MAKRQYPKKIFFSLQEPQPLTSSELASLGLCGPSPMPAPGETRRGRLVLRSPELTITYDDVLITGLENGIQFKPEGV